MHLDKRAGQKTEGVLSTVAVVACRPVAAKLGSMIVEYRSNPQQLANEIAIRMNTANLDWYKNDGDWTRRLKSIIGELFQTEGANPTDVLCSDKERGTHEFLLDVVVWDRNSGEGVTLAVESEWAQHHEAIAEDFWKLMVVKSPLKLMVFALSDKARVHSREVVWEKLADCLLKYRDHHQGERYLFMNFGVPPAVEAWWIEIPVDGPLANIPEKTPIKFD